MSKSKTNPSILLTGATGYVGGRLLSRLEEQGYRVRCLARNPETLKNRVTKETEIVQGDVLDIDSLQGAFDGVDTCFYLIHSMGQSENFENLDRQAASNFGRVAKDAGVKRIIYLGGLGDEEEELSTHLKSRHEVGKVLMESGVQTLELRASIIIGSGSLSFEMIRALTEKLPVMITPQWVNIKAQPLGINDLLRYLIDSIALPITENRVIEIGGKETLSYKELMAEYARIRGLKRLMIPIPMLTPGLSSLWLGLVTPLFARVGRKLVDSIRHTTVITDASGIALFDIRPKGVKEMIQNALNNEDKEYAETRWSDAISSSGLSAGYGGMRLNSRLIDSREIQINVPPEKAFEPVANIGGEKGWYGYNWLWRIRGMFDLLIGGVGMRRRRPEGRSLRDGDSLDFWRVETYDPPQRLRLHAEMKLPGAAWLEFEVSPTSEGCKIRQTAEFYPKGLSGLLYWYGIYPLHALVFKGMIRGIARAATSPKSE